MLNLMMFDAEKGRWSKDNGFALLAWEPNMSDRFLFVELVPSFIMPLVHRTF